MADGWLNTPFQLEGQRVWVAGHNGMVGQALVRRLKSENCEILTVDKADLDLRDQAATRQWIEENKPDVVIVVAARVGGILANSSYPAEFLYDNLMIETNIVHTAYKTGVQKLLFLGSSCIYPKEAPQPIQEDSLLSGRLEPTNEAYSIAKIAGIKLCQAYRAQYGCDFISAMPCNLYGPGDVFDEESSHVIPALMMKAHAAKVSGAGELIVWGSGRPLREFLHVDDAADALVFMLKHYSGSLPVNVGSGVDVSIGVLAEKIVESVGFKGHIVFDNSKPDGTFRKLMDSSMLRNAGWKPETGLIEGLKITYAWYCEKNQRIRKRS